MTDAELVMERLSWRDDCAQLLQEARNGASWRELANRSGMNVTKFLAVIASHPEQEMALDKANEDFLATK